MLGLPLQTELKKQIAKSQFIERGEFKRGEQGRFDEYISSVFVVNEINARNVAVADDGEIKQFFVLLVEVKKKETDDVSLKIIEKSIKQHKIIVLKYKNEYKCLAFYGGLIQTEWGPLDGFDVTLQGTTVIALWENIIRQLGHIKVAENKTLLEQIEENEKREKLLKEIERLEDKSRKAVQPKEKMKFHQQAMALKELIELS